MTQVVGVEFLKILNGIVYVFFFSPFQNNEVMASTAQVRSRRVGLDKNTSKKWPLLVRSLSDSAKLHLSSGKPPIKTETKALTLSLSDSRLFSASNKKSLTFLSDEEDSGDLEETVLLDILSSDGKDPETCSCGCDRAGSSECLEEDCYSEDEGCFVITSVPASNEEQEEVTNKVKTHQG